MKRIVIVFNRKQARLLQPYLKGSLVITPKSAKNYIQLRGITELFLEGKKFIQKWIDNNPKINKYLTYDEIQLLDLMSYNLISPTKNFHPLGEIIGTIDFLKAVIKKEKPDQIIIADDNSLTSEILKKISNPILIKAKKQKNNFLAPIIAKNLIKLKLSRGALKNIPNSKGDLLFLVAGSNYVSPTLPLIKDMKEKCILIKPLLINDNKVEERLKKENLQYTFFENYLDPNTLDKINSESKRISNILKLLSKEEKFRSSFVYKGVPIYAILKETFNSLFNVRGKLLETIATIEITKRILEQVKPKVIILVEEENLPSRTLIKLGKRYNIPTLLMQHGFLSCHASKTPFICDKLLVWGDRFKKDLEKYNKHKDIIVTGKLSDDNFTKEAILKKYNLNPNKRIVTLATNFLADRPLILETMKAVKNISNTQLIIKLHPMENGKLPQKLANLVNIEPLIIRDVNLDEIMSISDLVIVSLSTVGLDALKYKKPLIVVDQTGIADEMDYIKSGAALGIYDLKDLEGGIKKLLTKNPYSKKANLYTKNHIKFHGKQALEKTKQVINQLLG